MGGGLHLDVHRLVRSSRWLGNLRFSHPRISRPECVRGGGGQRRACVGRRQRPPNLDHCAVSVARHQPPACDVLPTAQEGQRRLDAFGMALPASNEAKPIGRQVSPFVRKPGYQFGWDWGPRLAGPGIHGDVVLQRHDQASRIQCSSLGWRSSTPTPRKPGCSATAGPQTFRLN